MVQIFPSRQDACTSSRACMHRGTTAASYGRLRAWPRSGGLRALGLAGDTHRRGIASAVVSFDASYFSPRDGFLGVSGRCLPRSQPGLLAGCWRSHIGAPPLSRCACHAPGVATWGGDAGDTRLSLRSSAAGGGLPPVSRLRRPAGHGARSPRRQHRTTQCPARRARVSAPARSSRGRQTVGCGHPSGTAQPGGLGERAAHRPGYGGGKGHVRLRGARLLSTWYCGSGSRGWCRRREAGQ